MRISSSDPLAARATSASKGPSRPLAEDHDADLESDELQLEAWPEQLDRADYERVSSALTLPYPPALNSLYGHRVLKMKGRPMAVPYKTHEHRDYMKHVGEAIGTVPLWAGPLRVDLKLYRPRRVGDIDGPIKTLFDALNGRVWTDDSQVVELHITRHDDKHHPRVEVSITAVPPGA